VIRCFIGETLGEIVSPVKRCITHETVPDFQEGLGMTRLEQLGRRILEKRGATGLRAVANEIGISPATLSRVERGKLPDLETFQKICRWLDVDPGEILGVKATKTPREETQVHFRKRPTISEDTASALAKMVLAAQRAMEVQGETEVEIES
jgi:transcriptional regulator with XRE-family HTH domain